MKPYLDSKDIDCNACVHSLGDCPQEYSIHQLNEKQLKIILGCLLKEKRQIIQAKAQPSPGVFYTESYIKYVDMLIQTLTPNCHAKN